MFVQVRLLHPRIRHHFMWLLVVMVLVWTLELWPLVFLPLLGFYWGLVAMINFTNVFWQSVFGIEPQIHVRVQSLCVIKFAQLFFESTLRIFWHQWVNCCQSLTVYRVVAACWSVLNVMRSHQFSQLYFLVCEFLLRTKRVLMVLKGDGVHRKAIAEACLFETQLTQMSWLLYFFHIFFIILKLISSDSGLPLNLDIFTFF